MEFLENNQIIDNSILIKNSILLSLCIPTYNRASVLDKCIERIVAQSGFDIRTEVVVLDNNSSDDTKEVVMKYSNIYPNIIYFCNEVNIGMEKNIIKVLTLARGSLLKLINDYSIFSDNSLENMLRIINKYDNQNGILYFTNKENKQSEVLAINDLDSFFRNTTYWATWIGTFSIWKTDFMKFKDTEIFEGLLFPHLLIFLENFKQKKQVLIIPNVFFTEAKGITKGGYDFFEVFIENFIGKIIHKLYEQDKINRQTLYYTKINFINKFLTVWVLKIFLDKTQHFNKNNFNLIFKYYKYYPQLYYLIFKIAIYRSILNLNASIYKKRI